MLKIHKRSFVILILIVVLSLEFVFSSQVLFLKYADEAIAVTAIVYIMICLLQKKTDKIDPMYLRIMAMLGFICVLGFCGNMVYRISPSFFASAVDCLGVVKSLMTFIFVSSYLSNIDAMRVAWNLYRPAKLFLWFAVFFGIISIFIDIGMGGEVRFGLRAYTFIFEHAHMLAIMGMCAFLLIAVNEKRDRNIYFYAVITCICLFLTTKGPSIIWSIMIFIMFRYYVHNKKIRPWLIVFMIVLCANVGSYQITNYIMNTNAPRAIFLKYGIITANRYFPLGSGFATFGSDMAKVYYSKLYYEYGFHYLRGMTEVGGMYLNDNYWPMLMAQTGYIGAILFLWIYYKFFIKMQQSCPDRRIRAILITNYIYIMAHSLGFASLTGMEGVLSFAVMGMVVTIFKKDTTYKSAK